MYICGYGRQLKNVIGAVYVLDIKRYVLSWTVELNQVGVLSK